MTPPRHIMAFASIALIAGTAWALGLGGWLEHGTQYASTEMTGGQYTMVARAGQPMVGTASNGDWTLTSGGVHVPQDICLGDLDGSGITDITDLLAFLGAYGTAEADLNGDGLGDINDLLILLAAFGGCG